MSTFSVELSPAVGTPGMYLSLCALTVVTKAMLLADVGVSICVCTGPHTFLCHCSA